MTPFDSEKLIMDCVRDLEIAEEEIKNRASEFQRLCDEIYVYVKYGCGVDLLDILIKTDRPYTEVKSAIDKLTENKEIKPTLSGMRYRDCLMDNNHEKENK